MDFDLPSENGLEGFLVLSICKEWLKPNIIWNESWWMNNVKVDGVNFERWDWAWTPNEMIFWWMNLITRNEVKVDGWICGKEKGWLTLTVETSQLRKLNSMHQIGTHVLLIQLMGEIDQLNYTTNNNDPWMNVSDPIGQTSSSEGGCTNGFHALS